MKIDVVLVEPQTPGNIGAVARVMKNFGFKNLVLIEPQCDHKDEEARNRAKHANDVLNKARKKSKSHLKKYDYVIGTTSRLGGDYNIPRSPVSPAELAFLAKQLEGRIRIAVVFGRESDGLTNEEISECDFVVSIPTETKYPSMNLSHAVAVVLYELHKAMGRERIGDAIKPMGRKEKEKLLELVNALIDDIDWRTETRKETQKQVWEHIAGRSFLTNREAMALMGFIRELKKKSGK